MTFRPNGLAIGGHSRGKTAKKSPEAVEIRSARDAERFLRSIADLAPTPVSPERAGSAR
jgi:hypothetical protein